MSGYGHDEVVRALDTESLIEAVREGFEHYGTARCDHALDEVQRRLEASDTRLLAAAEDANNALNSLIDQYADSVGFDQHTERGTSAWLNLNAAIEQRKEGLS